MEETSLPRIGLGTSKNTNPEQCAKSIRIALEMGYKHLDTAQAYNNESYVGDGIAKADVPRRDIFLATKIDPSNLRYSDVIESTKESLERLGVDYIDLLYIHWPTGEYDPTDTLPAFDELYNEGTIRNIGLSNFTPEMVDQAVKHLDSPILALQNEMHPYLQQEELVKYCQQNEYALVAFSPLMKGKFTEVSTLKTIARDHGVTPAQAAIAWLLSKNNVKVIPKATSEEHIRQNFEAGNIELTSEEVQKIDDIDHTERIVWRHDPEFDSPWK